MTLLRWLMFAILIMAAVSSPAADRVALVIGNDDYKSFMPLQQAKGDARRVASTLLALPEPFRVTSREDADRLAMSRAVDEFSTVLARGSGEVALLYYAGHAVSHAADVWLLPVDAKVETPSDIEAVGWSLTWLSGKLKRGNWKATVVVLDACRNALFADGQAPPGLRGDALPRGLIPVPQIKGLMVAYATAAGAVAIEDASGGGRYTQRLIQHLKQPGLKLQDVFNETALQVERETSQRPELMMTAMPAIYLAGRGVGQQPAPGQITLRADSSLAGRKVLVHGHGLVPRQGLSLRPGRHVVQVELPEEDGGWGQCALGELELSGDRVLDATAVKNFALQEQCELSFEAPRHAVLAVGGKDRRFTWLPTFRHDSGPTEVLFVDGERVQPATEAYSDAPAFELSGYWEAGGNRMGGAERSVTACMDGSRAVAIARGYDKPGMDEEHYTEFLEILGVDRDRIDVRTTAKIDEPLTDEQFATLYQCDPDCTCPVSQWLEDQDGRRHKAASTAIDLLGKPVAGAYRVQSREAVEAALESLTETPGVEIIRDHSVVKITGLAPEGLWMGYSPQADAWQSVWLPDEVLRKRDESGQPIHGYALSFDHVLYALAGQDWQEDAFSYASACDEKQCWLFDPHGLRISSAFPEQAIKEVDYAAGRFVYQIERPVTWRPALSASLNDAFLGPVTTELRRLGGLPKIEARVTGDAGCLREDEWRRYEMQLEAALGAFNGVARAGGDEVPWEIALSRGGKGVCTATLTFPAHADLSTAWALWTNPESRAAHHVWQAVNAVATLPSPAWAAVKNSGEATPEVWRMGREESARIKALFRALDRDPDEASTLDFPACIGTHEVDVWRIAPEHSVVVDRPSNWKASATAPLLSTAGILRGVRKIDDRHLTYFRAEGDGWRFSVYDLQSQTETQGALINELPRYCVIDPLKRDVLTGTSDNARRATW